MILDGIPGLEGEGEGREGEVEGEGEGGGEEEKERKKGKEKQAIKEYYGANLENLNLECVLALGYY